MSLSYEDENGLVVSATPSLDSQTIHCTDEAGNERTFSNQEFALRFKLKKEAPAKEPESVIDVSPSSPHEPEPETSASAPQAEAQ